MELDEATIELLRPAAERLRRALQRFDPDDVPASLRRFADSSARRIPPPLVKRALIELNESDWLRAEAVEAEPDLVPGSPEELFLRRPDGWEARITQLAVESDERDVRRLVSQLKRQIVQQEKQASDLESRLAAAAKANETAENRAARRAENKVAAAERGRQRAEEQAREASREVERLQSRSAGLQDELRAAQDRVEVLRQRLEKERRAGTGPAPTPEPRRWFPDTPEEMAAELDRITVAIRRPPPAPPPQPATVEQPRLPEGVRPDGEQAIERLLRQPARWLLDGYNIAFQLGGEPDANTRRRVIAAAAQLVARSVAGTSVTVVFDSSVDEASIPSARRVLTVFAESADDWILENAGGGSVVVSSDRRVREGSEAKGAVGLWSEALVAWIGAGYPTG